MYTSVWECVYACARALPAQSTTQLFRGAVLRYIYIYENVEFHKETRQNLPFIEKYAYIYIYISLFHPLPALNSGFHGSFINSTVVSMVFILLVIPTIFSSLLGDGSKGSNYDWYHRYLQVPFFHFSSKILAFVEFFFNFHSLVYWNDKIHHNDGVFFDNFKSGLWPGRGNPFVSQNPILCVSFSWTDSG